MHELATRVGCQWIYKCRNRPRENKHGPYNPTQDRISFIRLPNQETHCYRTSAKRFTYINRSQDKLSAMPQTIVLITGASRGLGLATVQRFLALENHTVIAANRDPSHATSLSLGDLPKGQGSSLIVTAYDAQSEASPFLAVQELREKHGISHLDIVVPNAAISKIYPLAREVRRTDIVEHFEVNVLSVISLFQATRELLRASPSKKPVFAIMGSGAGSLGRQPPVPSSAYGASKSMLFWYGIRINAEEEWLNTFVIDPGWVQTEMGNAAARQWGMKEATQPVDGTMDNVVELLRTTTKEKHGGKAVLYTGEVLEW
ncbi:hypothetical protein F5X97DRAFT_289973 [Nemania serpens]|nr:hypothetical protein F5X97DRAFT_289973 [Nemania serpens]